MSKEKEAECCEVECVHNSAVSRAAAALPDEDELFDMAELFKVFGDSTRIKILCALAGSELCVCDIAEVLDMSQSAISHQLRTLKQAKLVKNRRDGKTIYYSLADDHVLTILGMAKEHLEEEQ
jgi:ArsR family transcriptional regulator